MKILIVGASGTLGKAVVAELGGRHQIIEAGRSGAERVDITDAASVAALFARIGTVDAIISTAGKVHFGPLAEMTDELFAVGLKDKLMGQVNLAMAGLKSLSDGGSITLTTGVLTDEPIRFGSSATMVNAAVEGFVRAAAIELPRGIRINAVSPTVLVEAMAHYAPYFRGFKPVSAADAALGYSKSVEGAQTGQIYKIG